MSFISKTFGGLNKAYYFRHFFFGLILFMLFEAIIFNAGKGAIDSRFISMTIMNCVSLFLYPYSRFVYESVVGYILGGNEFFVNAMLLFGTKIITMSLCFLFSWAIAPIGLTYLYFYHSKQEKLTQQEDQE
ncbi:hypothetical protein L5B71_08785 [Avibacterium sp. 21-586]|uniref:hypothetical protein n=1 Tax=Avibacterium sp. 21-586 TaxID=2911534 RepID=UPI002245F17E|nr:hypothetical protein [Avibacterium sp. 21-586]MCW9710931.1 hypothetical protein [Avibacterium sp. 21-586]